MSDPEYVIWAENLTRTFKRSDKSHSEKTAVNSISFKVKRGEIFGILGPNGAGKTTTIKMLSTLLTPTSGKAEVLGMDCSLDKNVRELRKRTNTVSGGERGLYYRLSGRQNLEFFADLYMIPKSKQPPLLDRLLELVELTDAADIKVENYSRGMKQRIHIARALINDPEILYLDEPTIGLDPEISKGIRKLIRTLSEKGTTVILTTHYMFEAEELCDRMIILSGGNIAGEGTPEDIKRSISDATKIHMITAEDPSPALESLRKMGIEPEMKKLLNGRFDTAFTVISADDPLDGYEHMFRPFGIKSMGIDEPTLEDAYLTLVKED